MLKRFFVCLIVAVISGIPSFVLAADGIEKQPDRLRLGVIIAADETARERVEPFRRSLEDIIDLPVDLFLMQTMADGIEALATNKIDYIRLSASAYAATFHLCECVEPLVTAGPDDFPARFYAIMLAKRGEETGSLEKLRNTRLAVGGKHAVASYRVPVSNLAADGIIVQEYFDTLVEVQNPLDGVRAILDGRVQASLGWSSLAGEIKNGFTAGTLNEYYVSGGRGFENLEVVWRSLPIPYSAHTIRSELPDQLKRMLRAGLMDLRRNEPAAYLAIEPDLPGGFEPVGHADYRPVLRTYDPQYSGALKTTAD